MTGRSKAARTADLLKMGFRPRILELALAAAYVGLSEQRFLVGVREGVYPAPIVDGSRRQWDVRALDAAVDRRSGLAASFAADESSEALMKAIDAA